MRLLTPTVLTVILTLQAIQWAPTDGQIATSALAGAFNLPMSNIIIGASVAAMKLSIAGRLLGIISDWFVNRGPEGVTVTKELVSVPSYDAAKDELLVDGASRKAIGGNRQNVDVDPKEEEQRELAYLREQVQLQAMLRDRQALSPNSIYQAYHQLQGTPGRFQPQQIIQQRKGLVPPSRTQQQQQPQQGVSSVMQAQRPIHETMAAAPATANYGNNGPALWAAPTASQMPMTTPNHRQQFVYNNRDMLRQQQLQQQMLTLQQQILQQQQQQHRQQRLPAQQLVQQQLLLNQLTQPVQQQQQQRYMYRPYGAVQNQGGNSIVQTGVSGAGTAYQQQGYGQQQQQVVSPPGVTNPLNLETLLLRGLQQMLKTQQQTLPQTSVATAVPGSSVDVYGVSEASNTTVAQLDNVDTTSAAPKITETKAEGGTNKSTPSTDHNSSSINTGTSSVDHEAGSPASPSIRPRHRRDLVERTAITGNEQDGQQGTVPPRDGTGLLSGGQSTAGIGRRLGGPNSAEGQAGGGTNSSGPAGMDVFTGDGTGPRVGGEAPTATGTASATSATMTAGNSNVTGGAALAANTNAATTAEAGSGSQTSPQLSNEAAELIEEYMSEIRTLDRKKCVMKMVCYMGANEDQFGGYGQAVAAFFTTLWEQYRPKILGRMFGYDDAFRLGRTHGHEGCILKYNSCPMNIVNTLLLATNLHNTLGHTANTGNATSNETTAQVDATVPPDA